MKEDSLLMVIPENNNEIFLDAEVFEIYMEHSEKIPFLFEGSTGIKSGIGINIFFFDVDSCEFIRRNRQWRKDE